MSTRQMARQYSGGAPVGPIGGGIWDLLASLTGQTNVEGGPQYDEATKQWSYTPYQGSKGLFGGQSRATAGRYNRDIGGAGYLNSQQGAIDKALAETQGTEARKTNKELSDQHIAQIVQAANSKVLAEQGVTSEGAADFNAKVTPLVIDNVRQMQGNKGKELAMTGRELDKPNVQAAHESGTIADMLKQQYANRKLTEMSLTSPGGAVTMEGQRDLAGGGLSQKNLVDKSGQVIPVGEATINPPKIGPMPIDMSKLGNMPAPSHGLPQPGMPPSNPFLNKQMIPANMWPAPNSISGGNPQAAANAGQGIVPGPSVTQPPANNMLNPLQSLFDMMGSKMDSMGNLRSDDFGGLSYPEYIKQKSAIEQALQSGMLGQ